MAWTEQQLDRFLAVTTEHRLAIAFRLGVLYGLRRSEVLALRWDDLDTEKQILRIDESLVATNEGAAWGNAKNERSRRTIPIDADTIRVFARRRAAQAAERQVALWTLGQKVPSWGAAISFSAADRHASATLMASSTSSAVIGS